jgi:hypothetical protein
LQTSELFEPTAGVRLTFWYKGDGQATGVLRLRGIPGVGGPDQSITESFAIPVPAEDWSPFVYEMGVPAIARDAGRIRAEVILYQRGAGTLWYDDVELERLSTFTLAFRDPAGPTVCPRRPEDGRVALQNPPDLWWPPQHLADSYTIQFSPDSEFSSPAVVEVAGLPYNVYSHRDALVPGTWYWRTRYTDTAGIVSEWTPAWRFVITDRSVPFTVPPAEDLLASIPAGHPRIYATPDTLDDLRGRIRGPKKEWWDTFHGRLEQLVSQEVGKEPPREWIYGDRSGPLTDDIIDQGRKLRGTCSRITARARDLAFGFLLTGDERYGEAAVQQLIEMASWDPAGVTSYHNHDQVFRDITWKMAVAYDHCWSRMTQPQREAVRAAVEARASILYRDFKNDAKPIVEYPYNSHGITAYGFLGICAVALAHESEAADDWFRFVGASYPAIFPPWGGEEGGWAQGVAYWKWSLPFAWWFYDALKSATGVDMYRKAWNRNTGWYKLYTHPPYCDRHHFGDGNHGPPGITDKSNLARLAAAYRNPWFQWYADGVPGNLPDTVYSLWWYDEKLPPRPPADLPQGMYFPDIGWAAMHSDLSDPDDVMLLFKSSPYGSFNHSHADQNSFVIYGYGEPLLIDSGYYDWYGSPHDKGWTRQTKAHNAILVNGEGQPIFDITAKGHITHHLSTPELDYVCGDATAAYHGRLERWQRHILFFPPDTFLIADDLVAPEPAEFTWCLHAENQMTLDPENRRIVVSRGQARADLTFLQPDGLVMTQNDQFTPPPTKPRPNEWHAYVTPPGKSANRLFVTAIHVRKNDDPIPLDARIARDGDHHVIALSRQGGEPVEITLARNAEGTLVWNVVRGIGDKASAVALPPVGEPVSAVGRLPTQPDQHTAEGPHDGGPQLKISVDGNPASAEMEHAPRYRGGQLLWGRFAAPDPGPAAVSVTAAVPVRVGIGGTTVKSGARVFLKEDNPVQVRCPDRTGTVSVALSPLLRDSRPMTCRPVDLAGDPPAGILVEGETFTGYGGGRAHAYSHRTFLSGGQGVETVVEPGQWTEWKVTVDRPGLYALVVKGAVFEESADRLIEIDGKPLGGNFRPIRFPNTGGFGATPGQWADLLVCDENGDPLVADLEAGTHVLRLTTLERKLNVDYLFLVAPDQLKK